MQGLHTTRQHKAQGNVLLCVLCMILVVSMIGGAVLSNCVTRFNVSCSQVRGWKESLTAAEAGGDIAYAEVRKTILNPSQAWSGWTNSGGVYTNSPITFGQHSLTTSSRVDNFFTDPATGNAWYRIRVKGTAPAQGLRRAGMDDRMSVGTKGDSLLRKIDLIYDHFTAAYGPVGDGTGKAIVGVSNPQFTRRIELIAAPITPFEAAVKCTTSFLGPGSAGVIDSFNSNNGAYYFCANNPSDPHFSDARSGSVAVATPNFATFNGTIYGNVATNGGTVTPSSHIVGTIDNNVPFTVPPFTLPTDLPAAQPSPSNGNGNTAINPPVAGSAANPTAYLLSSISGTVTINQVGTAQTYVVIHVTGNITGKLTVKAGVHARIIFDGNIDLKARDIDNQSGLAANLQFYGISPTDPSASQQINVGPPGDFAATFYAPSADFHVNGNPDITGAIVCKSYYGNGNTSWHYDRALDKEGDAVDYRVISYVEDTR